MKRCPSCNRTYTDETLRFCLEDGTPLVTAEQSTAPTVMMPSQPPPTIAFDTARITANQGPPSWTLDAQPKPKRRVWPWVLVGLVLLTLLGGGLVVLLLELSKLGSNANNANNANRVVYSNTPNANQKPSPSPASTRVEIKSVHMARENSSGKPGDAVESFSPSDRTVYCVIQLSDSQPGTKVKSSWIIVNAGTLKNRTIKELEYTTRATGETFDFHLTVPQDWPAGDYKVDLYLNGQFARSITYRVA